MKKTLVLYGAASPQGHTRRILDEVLPKDAYTLMDVGAHKIGYFDPEFQNQGDDFLAIAQQMVDHDRLIFATPIYWYAMSAPLKVLFDRFTDLTSQYKDLGKSLSGKDVYLVVTGASGDMPPGFEFPFEHTSKFFDMNYKGCLFVHTGNHADRLAENPKAIEAFKKLLS